MTLRLSSTFCSPIVRRPDYACKVLGVTSDGDRAKTLLTYANYAKVAGALLVSRAAVADWAKGRSVTPYRLRQLEQLLRPDLDTEIPPPGWAAALGDEIAQKVVERLSGVTAQELAGVDEMQPELDAAQRARRRGGSRQTEGTRIRDEG